MNEWLNENECGEATEVTDRMKDIPSDRFGDASKKVTFNEDEEWGAIENSPPLYSLMASARASIDSMSRLLVGSSRMMTSGFAAAMSTNAHRDFWPPERSRIYKRGNLRCDNKSTGTQPTPPQTHDSIIQQLPWWCERAKVDRTSRAVSLTPGKAGRRLVASIPREIRPCSTDPTSADRICRCAICDYSMKCQNNSVRKLQPVNLVNVVGIREIGRRQNKTESSVLSQKRSSVLFCFCLQCSEM